MYVKFRDQKAINHNNQYNLFNNIVELAKQFLRSLE